MESPMTLKSSYSDSIPAYRVGMERVKSEYEPVISSASDSLKSRLQRYFSALDGTYTYVNDRKKEVRARTYKKRMEIASKELEGIQAHIQISRRYGKMGDDEAFQLTQYAKNLYDEAIRRNKYAKSHNVGRTSNARHVKSDLSRLENKVIDAPLQKQSNGTRYWFYFDDDGDFRGTLLRGMQSLTSQPLKPVHYSELPDVPPKAKGSGKGAREYAPARKEPESGDLETYPRIAEPSSRMASCIDSIPYEPPRSKAKTWLAIAASIGLIGLGGIVYGMKNGTFDGLKASAFWNAGIGQVAR